MWWFLTNVNSCSSFALLSPVRLSVCRMCICLQRSCTILRWLKLLAILLRYLLPWPFVDIHEKFYGDRPRGTPPLGELNTRAVREFPGSPGNLRSLKFPAAIPGNFLRFSKNVIFFWILIVPTSILRKTCLFRIMFRWTSPNSKQLLHILNSWNYRMTY